MNISNEQKNEKMKAIITDKIQSILDKVNSAELNLFPATRDRLMQIVSKLQNDKLLSENDYETLKLNNL